jgi:gluconolactonase
MSLVALTDELFELVAPDAEVEKLGGECAWSEGPVWVPGLDVVLWSDIPNDRIMAWSEADGVREWATGVEFTNGHTLDGDGTIVSCSHGNRRIERRSPDGTVTPLVDSHNGGRLNSPNDVVVKRDGTIWFTDPPYGIASDHEGHAAPSEQPANHVFRFDPRTGDLTAVTAEVEEPNGLAFSVDESILYVSDTSAALRTDGEGNHQIVAFDVIDGRSLVMRGVFAVVEPGLPDGFRIAETGHLVTSSASGLQVFTAAGEPIGRIDLPEKTSNCVFGGPDGRTLFVTASSSLYRVPMKVRGAVQW